MKGILFHATIQFLDETYLELLHTSDKCLPFIHNVIVKDSITNGLAMFVIRYWFSFPNNVKLSGFNLIMLCS